MSYKIVCGLLIKQIDLLLIVHVLFQYCEVYSNVVTKLYIIYNVYSSWCLYYIFIEMSFAHTRAINRSHAKQGVMAMTLRGRLDRRRSTDLAKQLLQGHDVCIHLPSVYKYILTR